MGFSRKLSRDKLKDKPTPKPTAPVQSPIVAVPAATINTQQAQTLTPEIATKYDGLIPAGFYDGPGYADAANYNNYLLTLKKENKPENKPNYVLPIALVLIFGYILFKRN